jgi:hypothetical protein
MIKLFGIEGKEEQPLIEALTTRLFDGLTDEEFTCIGACGIQPGTRRRREIDLMIAVEFGEISEARKYRSEERIVDARRVRHSDGNYVSEDLPQGHRVYIRSLAASIEIKQHSANNIEVRGDDLYVRYKDRWEPVTSKLIQQASTCKSFFERNGKTKVYNVNAFIYLPNVRKIDLSKMIQSDSLSRSIIYADSTLSDFISGCVYQEGVFAKGAWNYSTLGQHEFDFKLCVSSLERFYNVMKPGVLEQERLELIGKKFVDRNKEWVKSLGSKMIAFTGLAGTGKTLKLLRASNDLLEDYMDPVLFLTFNRALARDLERLMQLQNLGSSSRITVWTIDSFLFRLASRFGLYDDFKEFIKDKKRDDVFEAIRSLILKEVTQGEKAAHIKDTLLREFTYAAIDEGQDWFQSERDIILTLFGPKNVILAAGTDQCLRAPRLANWKQDAKTRGSDTQVVPGKRSLRQTTNINKFNNALASELELDWSVVANPDLIGGEIYLFEKPTQKILECMFDELLCEKRRYHPIDYLIMASPSSSVSIVKLVGELRFSVWDAISEDDRDSIPLQDQIRCVSTASCRGLEGWSTMILDLDRWLWFAINRNRAIMEEKEAPTFFESKYVTQEPSLEDLRFLPKWFLIPFTRAKSKMFIQLPESSQMRRILLRLAESNPDFVVVLD